MIAPTCASLLPESLYRFGYYSKKREKATSPYIFDVHPVRPYRLIKPRLPIRMGGFPNRHIHFRRMTTAIETRNLVKNFGDVQAVQQLSLQVEKGEVFGLVGPNGAGKTTSMLMLVGLLTPDSGEVLLLGEPFHGFCVAARVELGWVPQSLAFYPEMTVRENVRFFGSLYDLPSERLKNCEESVLEACKLVPYADRTGYTLSGGLQRRLNLALGLVHEPRVLVLDEPTVGIDLESRTVILDHLRSLAKEGCSVVMATHYADEVVATSDRVALLSRGRVLSCDRLDHLLARLPREVEIEAEIADLGLLDRLRNLPNCSICRQQNHVLISIEAQVDTEKPIDWPWTLAEILAVLKSSGSRIFSLSVPQPTLDLLLSAEPTDSAQICKPGESSTKI